jgi:hypothetical protein
MSNIIAIVQLTAVLTAAILAAICLFSSIKALLADLSQPQESRQRSQG